MSLDVILSRFLRWTLMRKILLFIIVLNIFLLIGTSNFLIRFPAQVDRGYEEPEFSISMDTPGAPVTCLINQNYTVDCIKQEQEVLLPFSFVKDYFEVYGSFSKSESGKDIFRFEHSTGFVKPPLENYSATGIHADDVNYFVEGRSWVIYIDGKEGVPVCRQWFPEGFFFSTNIAQFGLSHYSQYVVDKSSNIIRLDEGGSSLPLWKVPDVESAVGTSAEDGIAKIVFQTSGSFDKPGIALTFNDTMIEYTREKRMYSLGSFLRFAPGSSITVNLIRSKFKEKYSIHYVFNNTKLLVYGTKITLGLGERQGWTRLTRNIYTDLERAILHRDGKITGRVESNMRTIWSLNSIVIRGVGQIHNLTLGTAAHLEHFYDAANWLLKNQDGNGGWPMPVKRKLGTYTLQPGWYSALSQGVCMSMMARAYWVTKEMKYLYSAVNATRLFHIPSIEGGIRAVFMDKYVWYEEYPTTPASFVLNGFITALLGLYDIAKIAPPPYNLDAQKLFDDGMVSLKALLPFFDSGYRTIYDLKHLTMQTEPNICRWDYHNLHVELLMYITTIDNDPIFSTIQKRWNKYRTGWRCPHN